MYQVIYLCLPHLGDTNPGGIRLCADRSGTETGVSVIFDLLTDEGKKLKLMTLLVYRYVLFRYRSIMWRTGNGLSQR